MTPLIIVPARQLSEGRPCKNREAWPALLETLGALRAAGPHRVVVVTDDPVLLGEPFENAFRYHYMDSRHTVAQVVTLVLAEAWTAAFDPIVILQPSSPTRNRASYVRAAVTLLEREPEITAVAGVVRWEGTPPTKACHLTDQGFLVVPPGEARQGHPPAYRRDGTVYAVRRSYALQGDLYGPRPVPLLIDPKDSVTLD